MIAGIEDLIEGIGDAIWGAFVKVGDFAMNMPDDIEGVLYDVMANMVSNMLGISERLAKEVLERGTEAPATS